MKKRIHKKVLTLAQQAAERIRDSYLTEADAMATGDALLRDLSFMPRTDQRIRRLRRAIEQGF